MKSYANRSGDSPVKAYQIIENGIEVVFGKTAYGYTESVTGALEIAEMIGLAEEGRGLSTYISKHIKKRYAYKRLID
jgi:hypothetical protein